MIHGLNMFKIVVLIFMLMGVQLSFAQKKASTLDRTVILKVKDQYRKICSKEDIKLPVLDNLLADIGVTKLSKMFPKKQKERVVGNVDLSLIYELNYSSTHSIEQVIGAIRKLNITEYVEPYYLPELTYTPSDTLVPIQYYLNLINAENAWNVNQGDTTVVIGITDTGWDPTHLDLQGNVKINYADPIDGFDNDGDGYTDNYMGWDLGNDDNNALWESTGHGVNVTGIAAAVTDNVAGVAGVGFNCKFLPVKISNGAGILTHAYQGIVYAADHGCFVINCSWGSYVPSQFSQNIIDYATINKGCLVVGAVGNDNGEDVFYPAGYDGVLSVAATEQSDIKKNNSNFGYYVDVSAPGETMWTTSVNGNYSTNGGTSMAAPVVSGGAALLKAQFPTYTNKQIAALIQTTADDLNVLNPSYADKLGSGRLNLFGGVSATTPQFVELSSHLTTDGNNNIFEFGDTLFIEGFFDNYLDPISGLTVTLSSLSPYVNIIDGITNLPAMGTLASVTNSGDKFTVEVLNGAAFNEVVTFKAVITNGTFTNNEYFTVTLNPDYINMEENLVATTITSNGKIGFNDVNNSVGLGFTYSGEQLLYEAGLMIGDDVSRVADVVRGVAGQDQDFSSQQNVQYHPPYKTALDLYGATNDYSMTSPLGLVIEQLSYANANAPDDKYIVVEYRISNTGLIGLTNISAGIFADWDIDNAMLNKAGYDATRKMGYVHSMSTDTLYAAIKVLTPHGGLNYSLDLDGSGGIDANGGGFTTSEKYGTLSSSRNSAGGSFGADVAHVVSSGTFSLGAGMQERIAFAIIAGDSLSDIQASADAAQIKYDNEIIGIEDYSQYHSLSIYPNPTTGIVYVNSDEMVETLIVRNVLGKTLDVVQSNQVDLSNLPGGIYLLEVVTKNTKTIQKIILTQ